MNEEKINSIEFTWKSKLNHLHVYLMTSFQTTAIHHNEFDSIYISRRDTVAISSRSIYLICECVDHL